ncbi:MAG: flagellar hook-associated protein FlgK [Pseudomonadota bacterium]
MSITTGIMSTLLSGLTTYQAAISVTGSNIANAESTGYSRQAVIIRSDSSGVSNLDGVEVAEVRRVNDRFCFSQVVSSTEDMGKLETEDKYMSYVESVFDESEGSGVNEALSDFWNGWLELVNNPSGYAERAAIVSGAETLCSNLNEAVEQLESLQNEIDQEISSTVDEINNLTERIADLNSRIAKAAAAGKDANTLLDSLDSLTEELAALVDINVSYSDNGQAAIQLADGKPLVSGGRSYSLAAEVDSDAGSLTITWNDGSGSSSSVDDVITSGALGGCLEVRDELIPGYLEDLDSLAATLIQEVNDLLESGYDLNGDPGTALFTGAGAGDIAVAQTLADDPNLLAAAGSESGSGDATIAQAMVELQDENVMNGGTSTLDEFYQALVAEVGADVEKVGDDYEQAENIAELNNNYRESVSGVSVDEETANLVLFQQAYNASAKVMTVLRELMETILDL